MMKHRSERWIYPTAALMMTAGMLTGGCSHRAQEEKSSVRIGVTVYDQYDTFISELMTCFNADINTLSEQSGRSITLEVMDASSSQTTQNDQVRILIEKGCDVICVNLVDRTEPTTITDLAEKNNVPIIFFNRELVAEDLERWEQLYYVGADATQSGQMQGKIAADIFLADSQADKNGDGVWQYITLEGEAGHQDAIIRTEYSVNAITNAGIEVEKLAYARANWNRAQAQTQMASLWEEYGSDIELVLANNDDMALGAIDALKAAQIDRKDWPVIVGIDGTDAGLAAVKAREMGGTVYNDKQGQAESMAELAYVLAFGNSLDEIELTDDKYIRMPYQIITYDNVNDFM